MPREMKDLMELATLFGTAVALVPIELHEALTHVAEHIEKDAKSEFGVYQPAVGPHPAWAELADSTKDERVALGFSENDPLLRTGALRDDITHEVEGLEAQIGTPESAATADIMVYQEFGTSRMPARPVLGPAGYRARPTIEKLVGAALVAGLIGRSQVHAALGYDYSVDD